MQVAGEILSAGLVRGRVEFCEFVGSADDGAVVHSRGGDAVDKIGDRGYAVHEYPEPGQGLRGLHDAVEGQRQRKHESGEVSGCFGVGESGDKHLRKGTGEDEELGGVEEDEALALGGLVGAEDGEVIGGEDENAEEELPGEFDDDVGGEEGGPGVGFGGAFAGFVEGALEEKARHDLLDKGGEDGGKHEDGEDDYRG